MLEIKSRFIRVKEPVIKKIRRLSGKLELKLKKRFLRCWKDDNTKEGTKNDTGIRNVSCNVRSQ